MVCNCTANNSTGTNSTGTNSTGTNDQYVAATFFCVIFAVISLVQAGVIVILYGRLRGIKVEGEIKLCATIAFNWMGERMRELARLIVTRRRNRTHTIDLEESVQHEPVVNNFPDFPGAKPPSTTSPPPPQCTIDAVIEESPPVAGNAIQTMAEIMKASLKETEKDNSHAQQNDNMAENENIPLDDTEIIFATYDIARDTRQQALEPCDYEDPVSIMGNKSGKNKVLASYEYASGKKSAFDRSLEMGGVTAPTPKPRKGLDRGWSARK